MPKSVFVTGVTGKQGGAVSRELLRRGYRVTSVVRNSSSEKVKAFVALGGIVHLGDFDDTKALKTAMNGIDALYLAVLDIPVQEVTWSANIIKAAKECGVKDIVHASVDRTGDHETFPGWDESYPMWWYWTQKHAVETMTREAGFEHWTILRPAYFHQNFRRPDVEFLVPGLADTFTLRLAFNPDTRLHLIDAADVAIFAANAFDDPSAYDGKCISLASEMLTAEEMGSVLEGVSGKKIDVKLLTQEEITEFKENGEEDVMAIHTWQRDVGHTVDIDSLDQYGVKLRTMREALERDGLNW